MTVRALDLTAEATAPGRRERLLALGHEFGRYFAASAVALGLDVALLWLLTEKAGLHYLTSAAIGYSTGAVVHYVISIRMVFRERRIADRRMEFLGFFAIGLVGLAANQWVLKAAVDGFGQSYLIGKAWAVGVSFILTYVARRAALFTAKRIGA